VRAQLLYLQLAAAGAGDRTTDHVASHLGKAIGLTTLLRGVPHHAAQRRSHLPLDLCAQHGLSQVGG
jgi:NADH dehydrogenase [ubiquinone] 1 alpha subcomplex assembly factor 6